jgi:hypothetical protein
MPLFTKTVAGLAALISIPVFGASVIGANYFSPVLSHLVDIINGSSTQTVASLNAPNWSSGIPLAQPVGLSAATSTSGGTLASSTAFTIAIAATDGTGTTTLSSAVTTTTDASTSPNEEIQITWPAVPGATGYSIYVATGTSATFSQYFTATSTNGVANTSFTLSSTTGTLPGTNAQTDTTAFATKINPSSQSYLNGGGLQVLGQTRVGTTTAASSTELEINGYVRAQRSATSTECYAATAGEMFFNSSNSHAWGCNGVNWVKIF